MEEFSERVRACQARLYRVAVSISHADAEDAVSEALLKAWKHAPGLRSDAYFETWLTRIVINECRTLLRRGELTQALMELGACVCVPNGAPKCALCPLQGFCRAKMNGSWDTLPVKEAKKPRRQEQLTVFFLSCGSRYAVRRDTGLLAGLWELPNTEGTLSAQQALSLLEQWGLQPEQLQKVIERTHVFTHVEWHMRCCYVRVAEPGGDFTWVDGAEFSRSIALPTAFRMFWEPGDGQAEK